MRQISAHSSSRTGCTDRRVLTTSTMSFKLRIGFAVIAADRFWHVAKGLDINALPAVIIRGGIGMDQSASLRRCRQSRARCWNGSRTPCRQSSWRACCCGPDSCARPCHSEPFCAKRFQIFEGKDIRLGFHQPISHHAVSGLLRAQVHGLISTEANSPAFA